MSLSSRGGRDWELWYQSKTDFSTVIHTYTYHASTTLIPILALVLIQPSLSLLLWLWYSPWYQYGHPSLYSASLQQKKITAWLTCCLNPSWAGVNLLMPNCITQEVVRVVSCSMCIMYIMCEYWASARLLMHKQTWPLLDPAVHSSFIVHTVMHVNVNFKCHLFLGVGDPGNQSIGLIPKYQVSI